MLKKLLKVALILFTLLLFLPPVFIFWMRTGEEEPLDYSAMDFELGPNDPEVNGYTYLRQFCEENHADIPDNYPEEYSDDYETYVDYNRYENWDLDFFQEIVDQNKGFIEGMEQAFDLSVFRDDQEATPVTLMPHVGQLRAYLMLRLLEARVLYISGNDEKTLTILSDLTTELKTYNQSGSAIIGLLTGIALNGMLSHELWVYQARGNFSAEQLKQFADGYDVGDTFAEALALSMRQEFQFVRNIIDEVSKNGATAYELDFAEPPSQLAMAQQKLALFVGLRETQTLNEFFQAYLEVVEESQLPVIKREFTYADEMEARLSQRNWGSFRNRNPYGTILLATLYPALSKVLEKVEMAKASSSATRISIALQAYYLEKGELPESLEALVPEYLPNIPSDPYDGEPMRYSKERKIVYAVGNDFVDQGGSEQPFLFQLDAAEYADAAEYDDTEPTYPLRFALFET